MVRLAGDRSGGILISMSRLSVFVLTVVVGLGLAPLSGLDCSPRGAERLPCCDEPASACHQIGDAGCCPNASPSSGSGAVAAAPPTARPHDSLVMAAAHAIVLARPAFTTDFPAFARRAVESPPHPPAVLRL